jgi:hypothetical protein
MMHPSHDEACMRFFKLIHVCMKDHDEACMRFIFHSEYESHVMINVEILVGSDPGSPMMRTWKL